MASLKLKITQQNRNRLFYSKYSYKVTLSCAGVRLIFNSEDYAQCVDRINTLNINISRQRYSLIKEKIDVSKLQVELLTSLIIFYTKYKNSKQVTFLRSGKKYNDFICYTNDIAILEEIADIFPQVEIIEALPAPPKIMYFSKEPLFNYRIYLKSTRVKEETIQSLITFIKTKPESVHFSTGLTQYANQPWRWKWGWLPNNCFIDFRDEHTLTIMYLLFNECLRKSYKLEKRP